MFGFVRIPIISSRIGHMSEHPNYAKFCCRTGNYIFKSKSEMNFVDFLSSMLSLSIWENGMKYKNIHSFGKSVRSVLPPTILSTTTGQLLFSILELSDCKTCFFLSTNGSKKSFLLYSFNFKWKLIHKLFRLNIPVNITGLATTNATDPSKFTVVFGGSKISLVNFSINFKILSF
jgi:hypothetical protein